MDQGYSTKANTQDISTIVGTFGRMLCSPFSTSESGIDVITEARWYYNRKNNVWKTVGVDVRHLRSLGFKLGR